MGWRGTVRSLGAAMRAAERQAERNRKAAHKERVATDSAEAVEALENYLENLISVHTSLAEAIDWDSIASMPRPLPPEPETPNQDKTLAALEAFTPSPLDVFRGGSERRRLRLERQHDEAYSADLALLKKRSEEYEQALSEWHDDTLLARRLATGEAAALRELVAEMQNWTSESRIGSFISFEIDDWFLHAKPTVHSSDIVPRIRRKQLASGRLSESQMPTAQFNDLYQDYVASVALRIGGDLFNVTPLDEVYVTCLAEMLNGAMGHKEEAPILSVHFVRPTFEGLNLAGIDPSDAISNFRHNMRYKRSAGFERVEFIASPQGNS